MNDVLPEDMWRSAAVIDAERSLDAAWEGVADAVREAEEVLAELKADTEPPTEEEVRWYRELVTGPARTPQWDAIVARIASGELTWEGLVSGEHVFDPGVQAATATLRDYQPDVPDAAPRPPARVDDDTYYDDFTVRRDDAW